MSLEGPAPRDMRWMPGVAIALFTGCYQILLASNPPNDQFMNIVWGREIVAAHLPVRDYFEAGEPLSEAVSAFAEKLLGYRLLSEALIVGLAFGLSAWLVYKLVRELTTGTFPAVVAATLVAVAGTRGYSYPKILIYAVGATLFWRYVRRPSFGRLTAVRRVDRHRVLVAARSRCLSRRRHDRDARGGSWIDETHAGAILPGRCAGVAGGDPLPGVGSGSTWCDGLHRRRTKRSWRRVRGAQSIRHAGMAGSRLERSHRAGFCCSLRTHDPYQVGARQYHRRAPATRAALSPLLERGEPASHDQCALAGSRVLTTSGHS